MVYDPYIMASPNRPGYATPQADAPPWANYGSNRVTPGPGGGRSVELDPYSRPYWANSNYLYGGMGGMRPGMSVPNHADYYRRNQTYEANLPSRNQAQPRPEAYMTRNDYSAPQQSQFTMPMPRHNQGTYYGGGMMGSYSSGAPQRHGVGGYGGITGGFMGGRY